MLLGLQSLYDVVLRDFLFLAIFSNNIFSFIFILSTFELQLADKQIIATSLIITHTVAFVSLNFHAGCLSIVRIVCMIDMNFMEETLGEILVRNLLAGISLTAAIGSSCFQILNDDMNTGTIYFLITKETVISGNNIALEWSSDSVLK